MPVTTPVKEVVPVTAKLPPTNKLPPTPTPPDTRREPVTVLIETEALETIKSEVNVLTPPTFSAPVLLTTKPVRVLIYLRASALVASLFELRSEASEGPVTTPVKEVVPVTAKLPFTVVFLTNVKFPLSSTDWIPLLLPNML